MDHAIVYFDGVCNFCNSFINFLIKHDKKDYFRYTPLQSIAGEKFLKENNLFTLNPETFYLYEKGKIYSRSTAALRLLKNMGWKFSWMYVFIIIPSMIRDVLVYNPIAKRRYKWFGKMNQCMVPTEEVKSKFVWS